MQRILLGLVFTVVSINSFSQEPDHVKKERLKNFYIAPSFASEFLSLKNYTEQNNGYSIAYKGNFSMRLGLDLAHKFSDELILTGGLFFATKNYERTETCQECANDYYYFSKFRNRYVEANVGVTYNFLVGRFDIGAYANMNLAYQLDGKEIRKTESGNEYEFDMHSTSNIVLPIAEPGLNFNYNLSYRLSLGLRTGYRFYFSSIESGKPFTNNGILVQPGLFYMF